MSDHELNYRDRTLTAPKVVGMVLFEVYEASGSLLLVTSSLGTEWEAEPGDYVVRREWATAVMPTVARVVEDA